MNGHTYYTAIHTHPGVKDSTGEPSKDDYAATGIFDECGFKKCMVYSAKWDAWVVYWGEKDGSKNEKNVNEIHWDR